MFLTAIITLPSLLSLPAKANILIDQTCHARLADFGLLTILSEPTSLLPSSSYTQGGTARWMCPELITPSVENSRPTISSDCYALGMVIYETISGNLPFHEYADLAVVVKVLAGERPPRGAWFVGSLWRLLEQCWASQSNDRPSIADVLRCLEMVSNSSEPHSPGTDEEMEEDSDDWDSESGSSDALNGTGGMMETEGSTTVSFGFSDGDLPPSPQLGRPGLIPDSFIEARDPMTNQPTGDPVQPSPYSTASSIS